MSHLCHQGIQCSFTVLLIGHPYGDATGALFVAMPAPISSPIGARHVLDLVSMPQQCRCENLDSINVESRRPEWVDEVLNQLRCTIKV
eukprot:21604-Amphidinium_carterae.1